MMKLVHDTWSLWWGGNWSQCRRHCILVLICWLDVLMSLHILVFLTLHSTINANHWSEQPEAVLGNKNFQLQKACNVNWTISTRGINAKCLVCFPMHKWNSTQLDWLKWNMHSLYLPGWAGFVQTSHYHASQVMWWVPVLSLHFTWICTCVDLERPDLINVFGA